MKYKVIYQGRVISTLANRKQAERRRILFNKFFPNEKIIIRGQL